MANETQVPQVEPVPTAGWIVTEISLTKEAKQFAGRCTYRYHVHGINLWDNGRTFSWTVPDLDCESYDLSRVTVPAFA